MTDYNDGAHGLFLRPGNPTTPTTTEHVILVAVTVESYSRRAAHEAVMAAMPTPGTGQVTSWWVAEDERYDGSDNDSAVFCEKGAQSAAFQRLRSAPVVLTRGHNDPKRRPQ